ncbi:hypothetical protein, partial [Rhodococcus opacus]|uniref:hypothetical protein n=1 Tax=Rhodococcus opacus TaxID=37919 RepID=UPI0012FDF63C
HSIGYHFMYRFESGEILNNIYQEIIDAVDKISFLRKANIEIKRSIVVMVGIIAFMLNQPPPKELVLKYHGEISRAFDFIQQMEKYYYLSHYQEAFEKAILGPSLYL